MTSTALLLVVCSLNLIRWHIYIYILYIYVWWNVGTFLISTNSILHFATINSRRSPLPWTFEPGSLLKQRPVKPSCSSNSCLYKRFKLQHHFPYVRRSAMLVIMLLPVCQELHCLPHISILCLQKLHQATGVDPAVELFSIVRPGNSGLFLLDWLETLTARRQFAGDLCAHIANTQESIAVCSLWRLRLGLWRCRFNIELPSNLLQNPLCTGLLLFLKFLRATAALDRKLTLKIK